MQGHFPVEVGRAMEDEFNFLLERLGYRVHRKRETKYNLDFVGIFHGEPVPRPVNRCNLLLPRYSPQGPTAFSLKRGAVDNSDVVDLLTKMQRAKNDADDMVLQSLAGGVIVTNQTRTEGELDDIRDKGVYAWDIRRLLFYAVKARVVSELARSGTLRERLVEGFPKVSYLLHRGEKVGSSLLRVAVVVFADEHNPRFTMAGGKLANLLSAVVSQSLNGIVKETDFDLSVSVSMHILGLADVDTLQQAYHDYAGDNASHPQIGFGASLSMFQYVSAPWAILLR